MNLAGKILLIYTEHSKATASVCLSDLAISRFMHSDRLISVISEWILKKQYVEMWIRLAEVWIQYRAVMSTVMNI